MAIPLGLEADLLVLGVGSGSPTPLTPAPKACAAAVSGIRAIAFFLSWTGGSRLPFELFHRVAYN